MSTNPYSRPSDQRTDEQNTLLRKIEHSLERHVDDIMTDLSDILSSGEDLETDARQIYLALRHIGSYDFDDMWTDWCAEDGLNPSLGPEDYVVCAHDECGVERRAHFTIQSHRFVEPQTEPAETTETAQEKP